MRTAVFVLLVLSLAACGPSAAERAAQLPTLAPTPLPPPQPADVGTTVTGGLSLDERIDEWRFSGEAGRELIATADVPGLRLTLFDAAGQPLATTEGRLQATLPTAGAYTLRLQLLAGDAVSYALDLRYAPLPTPTTTATPTPVVIGGDTPAREVFAAFGTVQGTVSSTNPAFGGFNTPDERHVYTFQGAEGLYVRLQMRRTSGTVDPILTLYTPDATAIAIDDNSGGGRTALLKGVRLPRDGVYGVVAYGDGFTGTYELTLETAPEPFPVTPMVEGQQVQAEPTLAPIVLTPTLAFGVTGNRLEDHVPIIGTIDRPGEIDFFSIEADAGEVFTIGVSPDEGLRLSVQILDRIDGTILAEQSQIGIEGDLLLSNITAPERGAYRIFITGQDDTTGSYRVSYGRGTTREDVRRGETFPDRTYDAVMNRRGVRDVWYLRLNQGDMITASAASRDGRFDPVLELVDDTGALVIRDDNSGGGSDARIQSVRANRSGVYALRVRGANPEVFGAYALVWRYIEAAPTPTPPLRVVDVFAVDDVLPDSDFLTYPLQGRAGERLLLEVNAAPGSGLDPVLAVLDNTGAVIAEDDDSGGDLNPRLITQLPADGLYQIRVGGYYDGINDSGGPFVLRVQRLF